MIYNAVIHIKNEQPLIADLFEMPSASDLGLRCTNLRTLDGKRPVFIDDQNSFFFFAYEHVRFVEITPASLAETGDKPIPIGARARGGPEPVAAPEDDLEIDEDFLRRIREV